MMGFSERYASDPEAQEMRDNYWTNQCEIDEDLADMRVTDGKEGEIS